MVKLEIRKTCLQKILPISKRGVVHGNLSESGNKSFWESIRSKIYIDKTNLIACTNEMINTDEKFVCVSRPRRFEKSMTLNMLAAYYSRGCDSAALFRGLKIEQNETFSEYLNQCDVIFLNMQRFLLRAKDQEILEYLEQAVLEELWEAYGDYFPEQTLFLAEALEKIYARTEKQFVFLIDEWDCVMRERQDSETLQKQYLDFLRFVFEEYTGFTESEVMELCRQYHVDFSQISGWYDGYMLRKYKHIYNPRSVVAAMKSQVLSNYWTATETYEALKVYMDMDFDGLRTDIVQMLGGERVKVNTLSFQNDMRNLKTKDDVLTLLIHLGYLGYDSEKKEAFIPNQEIMGEFENAMSVSGWPNVMEVLSASERLLEATLRGDETRVAEGLDKAHMEAASILTYNDENSLSCAIGLAYYSARKDYRLIRELPAGHGFADIVFLPLSSADKPALVVELKYDKSADAAIRQIKDRRYTQALEGYTGEILLVGVNYAKEDKNKRHRCVIERVEK